jgi:enoyl-CoA hydratase
LRPTGRREKPPKLWRRRSRDFPQAAVRADRRSVYLQHGLPARAALEREWTNCTGVFAAEGAAGVARFAKGAGRHGDFGNVTRP